VIKERAIHSVRAREIIDCRGFPTIQATVQLEGGAHGTADVACGKSTGRFEARELRDGGTRFGGRGVMKAVANINERIGPSLIGKDVTR